MQNTAFYTVVEGDFERRPLDNFERPFRFLKTPKENGGYRDCVSSQNTSKKKSLQPNISGKATQYATLRFLHEMPPLRAD